MKLGNRDVGPVGTTNPSLTRVNLSQIQEGITSFTRSEGPDISSL